MAFVPEGRQRQQNPHCSVQDPAGHTCECLKDTRGMHTEQTVSLDKIRFPPAPPPYRCFATAEARIYTKSPKICKSPENKREFWMPVIFLSTGSIHPSATRISLRLEKCTFLVGGITSQVASRWPEVASTFRSRRWVFTSSLVLKNTDATALQGVPALTRICLAVWAMLYRITEVARSDNLNHLNDLKINDNDWRIVHWWIKIISWKISGENYNSRSNLKKMILEGKLNFLFISDTLEGLLMG